MIVLQCLLLMTPRLHINSLFFSKISASVLEKMQKTKRGGDDLTIRSHESRKAHVDKETTELVASCMLVLPLLLVSL